MLDVQGLHVAYGLTTVIEDVSLDLHSGEVVALIGPNGVGKSTLLKGIASLYNEALKALGRFGIGHLQGRTLDMISGGQRQLTYLAQALFIEPGILLLDEPTAALDLRHQLIVLEAVRGHALTHDTTIVVAMHDLTMASQFCDRMICLHQGLERSQIMLNH